AVTATAERLESEAVAALFEDLDAPRAIAAMFDFVRAANAELDRGGSDSTSLTRAREAFARVNSVLDLSPRAAAERESGATLVLPSSEAAFAGDAAVEVGG